jgi:FAD/FMN-containing dehydrogenase
VRGGGGSFGIVTAIELELYPLQELYAGMLAFPVQRASEILRAWREWVRTVPDEATSLGRILHFPPLEDIPAPLRGQSFVVVEMAYLGDEASASELLAPLRALGPAMDTFATVTPADLLQLHMDPPQPVPGVGDGALLDVVPGEAIDALVAVSGADTPLLSVELRHLGGAVGRAPQGHGALAALDGDFAFFAVGIAPHPAAAEAVKAQLDVLHGAICEWDAGRRYLNFTESAIDTRRAFTGQAYRRLQAIKTLVDPDNVFRANHPIAPID